MGNGRTDYADDERALLAAWTEPAAGALSVSPLPPAAKVFEPSLLSPPQRPKSWTTRARGSVALLRKAATPEQVAAALRGALDTEWERGTPFLLTPVFLGLGAAIYFSLRTEPEFLSLLALFVILAVAAFFVRHRPTAHMLFASALVLLGVLAGKMETWRAGTQVLGSEITTRITGRVAAIEHQARGRVRLTVDVLDTARPKLRYAPKRVRISARSIPDGIRPGGGISGIVRLMPPSGPIRPESYDFSFENYFDRIGASGFFLSTPKPTEVTEPASFSTQISLWLERLRGALATRIRKKVEGAEGEIAAALVTGVKAGIPEETNEAMRISGLYHVLSISGLHLALVAVTVMGSLRALFALFPGFASRKPVKKYAAAAALLTVFFYLYVSGASVATQRSFIMLAVMLAALMFDRAALTMRNLAIAAIIVILIAPHEVVGPSFQMSFAATAALIAAYAAWSERKLQRQRDRQLRSLPRRLIGNVGLYACGIAMTSIIAGTATALFAAWHFHRVAPLGLVANLAAMPVVSVMVMPAAVFAMVLMPFGLDNLPFWVMAQGIAMMIAVAEWTAAHSPFDVIGILPTNAMIAFSAGLIILTIATTRLRIAAVPFLAAGVVLSGARDLPDLLISEDARLVAMPLSEATLAVNRSRPNAFTVENWQRAIMARDVINPQPDPTTDSPKMQLPESGFRCAEKLCVARHLSGAVVAYAADAGTAAKLCGIADLIVIDDATAKPPCSDAAVITKRNLARRGSAVVNFVMRNEKLQADIAFAIREPYRPWHAHRAFSREARGLPPYKRVERKPVPARNDTASDSRRKSQ